MNFDWLKLAGDLLRLGYFAGQFTPAAGTINLSLAAIRAAAATYRRFHGLSEDADLRKHLALPRCGLPDYEELNAQGLRRWKLAPGDLLRVSLPKNLPVASSRLRAAFEAAASSWERVCGVRFDVGGVAAPTNIKADGGHIDGPWKTLAWSELPGVDADPRRDTLQQMYDSSEAWLSEPRLLEGVIAHEIGHALGLGHLAAGSLMAPVYNASIVTPQTADAIEVVTRYGESAIPFPQPPLPSDVLSAGPLLIAGKRYRVVIEPDA